MKKEVLINKIVIKISKIYNLLKKDYILKYNNYLFI